MKTNNREYAMWGPRQDKQPGSVEWCYQTLDLLKTRAERAENTWESFQEVVREIEATQAWNVIPPDNPYGSLEALLKAELGRTLDQVRSVKRVAILAPQTHQQTSVPVLHTTTSNNTLDVDEMARIVARHYHGKRGQWAYEAFDYINATYFGSALPTPLIVWALTPHGGCLGLTRNSQGHHPAVALHPSLLGSTQDAPWGVPSHLLGITYAFDVLLHECMHINVDYILGGSTGETSHNCAEWIAEVNRIAPLIGLPDIAASRTVVRRVAIEDAQPTPSGKQPTRTKRVNDGNVPMKAIASFPYGVRSHLGLLDFYTSKQLPFRHSLESVTGS
jgi:hypothetical protein